MNDAGGIRRVMIINQYYAPDVASSGQLIADLCEGLVEVGHEVPLFVLSQAMTKKLRRHLILKN